MQPLTPQTKERNRGERKRKIGKPVRDQENHIMSSEFYDSLITKWYCRKTLWFQIVNKCCFDFQMWEKYEIILRMLKFVGMNE